MRRPAQTRAQKQHAREQRALLVLRRAAVRYTIGDGDPFAFADLTAACDRYSETLSARDRRKLAGKMPELRGDQ
jgi:hypothetical protein